MDPTASTGAGGDLTSYQWNFGDGTSAASATAAIQYKSWPNPGARTITLTVTDKQGASKSFDLAVTVAALGATGKLNDTGIDWCSENINTPSTWVNNAVCSAVNWVGNLWGQQQDAFYGRDAQARAGTLTKLGAGMAGFDFTKLGSDGRTLANQQAAWKESGNEADGTHWDCVRDNTTGLIWEVKRNDPSHLRYQNHTYGWYNADTSSNGGSVGYQNNASTNPIAVCNGVADALKCNTQSYISAVNNLPAGQALCGFRDWRLPAVEELQALAHRGVNTPAIDSNYFPNTPAELFWASSPYAANANLAWAVFFGYGGSYGSPKSYAARIRLVRSGA